MAKKRSYQKKGEALEKFHAYQEYEDEAMRNCRMLNELFLEIRLEIIRESKEAIKC